MNTHLQIIGSLLIVLSFIHIIFPRYFNWKTELKTLSLINRQMMIVHTFFIALTVLLIGLLCVTSYTELINTSLGRTICLGFGVFWGIRLIFQIFIYSSKLWKGKLFETIVHLIFTFFWIYLSTTFFIIYLK
jgi:hypothetical protein